MQTAEMYLEDVLNEILEGYRIETTKKYSRTRITKICQTVYAKGFNDAVFLMNKSRNGNTL